MKNQYFRIFWNSYPLDKILAEEELDLFYDSS
jgi:hypothetical protein